MVVKRFLLLSLLLDRAVDSGSLPAGVPLLFRRDSKIKSSHEVPPHPPLIALPTPLFACSPYLFPLDVSSSKGSKIFQKATACFGCSCAGRT